MEKNSDSVLFKGDFEELLKEFRFEDSIIGLPYCSIIPFGIQLKEKFHSDVIHTTFGDPRVVIYCQIKSSDNQEMGPLKIDDQLMKELDNFYFAKFTLDILEWESSEQAYQASKFAESDMGHYFAINQEEDVYSAYSMGQSREHPIDPDFDREEAMYRCNLAKILQNKEIAERLGKTKGPITFSMGDNFWKDALPRVITRIRSHLKRGIVQLTDPKTGKSSFEDLSVRVPDGLTRNSSAIAELSLRLINEAKSPTEGSKIMTVSSFSQEWISFCRPRTPDIDYICQRALDVFIEVFRLNRSNLTVNGYYCQL